MNKIYTLLFSIILAGFTLTGYSQDTTHKAKKPEGILVPSVYKAIIRPGKKPITYKKADSLVKAKVAAVIKPDTTKKPVSTPAAPAPAPAFVDNTINGQYTTVVKKLYPFQRTMLDGFFKNVTDTLNGEKIRLLDSTTKITELNKNIKELQGAVNTKDQALSSTESKEDMSFLGLPVTKLVFTYMMWGLVVILGTCLGTVIYLSGANRHEARRRSQEYDDLIIEFQAYKAKATEKEKKLGRELQTERNKVDELLGLGRKD